ncbi:hypothetical protein [Microbacterium aurantiacum]|uniref:Uncharacterized protein n=1 Tax=Microbacterium aurantiacum TaxID=162393 RepID=A0ABT8FRF2_9MICO|nr:hypothetical protein [Microbacterium aurantiacum]MDN4463891.1 hypothetical protein [Microbacterium aurantiacum]
MTVNADLARIFGSDFDAIHLAPYGTTLPTTINGALDPAFEDVGWLHSDGLTETLTGSVNRIRGHQGNGVVRTRMTEPGTQIGFLALESKAQTNSLRYHEKSVEVASGVRKATRGPGQRIQIRSAVIDLFDADDDEVQERFIIPRFEISPNGDRTFASEDIAGYPFLGEIIGDYIHLASDLEPAEVEGP